jgi:flagellar biosynthesis chaperone FliJ
VKEEKTDQNMVSTIIQSLDDNAVELIDFDNLKNTLRTMQSRCEEQEKTSSELSFIKNEYRNRIIGMMKAVMACRHRENDAEMLSQLSGDIENIQAGELVSLYGRVAARFRDSFPTSFKYLTYPARSGNKKDWSEHKI